MDHIESKHASERRVDGIKAPKTAGGRLQYRGVCSAGMSETSELLGTVLRSVPF